MSKPTLEAFQASARRALEKIELKEDGLSKLDQKGPSFDFQDDGGVDSLDMLDVNFYVETDLDIHIDLDSFLKGEEPETLQRLYNSIK